MATETNTSTPDPAATENAPARNLTDADIAALAEAMKADPTTGTATTTEAAPAAEATNTEQPADRAAAVEAMKAQLRDEVKKGVADEIRQELIESGIRPDRKGIVRNLAEKADDIAGKIREGKATKAEIDAYANEAWASVLGYDA